MIGDRQTVRNGAVLACLAVSVLFAGCSLFGAPENGQRTLTPVSVPATDVEASDDAPLPPSVARSGVADPTALVAEHRRTLLETSFVVVSNTTIVGANETLWRSTVRVRVEDGGERYHYVLESSASDSYRMSAPAERIEWWYDGERVLERYQLGPDEVQFGYDADPSVGGPFQDPTDANRIFTLFAQVGGEPVGRTTRDGATLRRINGTAETAPVTLRHAASSREFAYNALVDSSGVVRSYRLSYRATFDNRSIRVHREVRFVAIGNTTVPRPAWYERALAAGSAPSETPSSSVSTSGRGGLT
jgi:hypothetical protein